MTITITVGARLVFMGGSFRQLSRRGINRLLGWLFSNAELVRGWDYGEYVFRLEVQP